MSLGEGLMLPSEALFCVAPTTSDSVSMLVARRDRPRAPASTGTTFLVRLDVEMVCLGAGGGESAAEGT